VVYHITWEGNHSAFLDRYRSLAMQEVCIIVRLSIKKCNHIIVVDGLAFLVYAPWEVVVDMRDRALGEKGGLYIAK
jgi:hypothetical protein